MSKMEAFLRLCGLFGVLAFTNAAGPDLGYWIGHRWELMGLTSLVTVLSGAGLGIAGILTRNVWFAVPIVVIAA